MSKCIIKSKVDMSRAWMCGKGCQGVCAPTWTSEHNIKLNINQFSLMHTNMYCPYLTKTKS